MQELSQKLEIRNSHKNAQFLDLNLYKQSQLSFPEYAIIFTFFNTNFKNDILFKCFPNMLLFFKLDYHTLKY